MNNERPQKRLLALNRPAPFSGVEGKFLKAVGSEVGEGISLKPAPEVFHRIELRGIRGEEVRVKLRGIAEKRLGPFGPVRQETVPEDNGCGFDLASKLVEKAAYIDGVKVGVRKEAEEKAYAISFRRHEQCRYSRNLSMGARSLRQNWRVPARRPTSPDQRGHQQAAFVYKDYGCSEPCGFFLTRGHSSFIQRAISFSSRSFARRRGFWGVQPRECRSLLTW